MIYLYGRKFTLVTDCKPFIHLHNTPLNNASNRLVKWKLALMEYDFRLEHRPGTSRCLATADFLSRVIEQPIVKRDVSMIRDNCTQVNHSKKKN